MADTSVEDFLEYILNLPPTAFSNINTEMFEYIVFDAKVLHNLVLRKNTLANMSEQEGVAMITKTVAIALGSSMDRQETRKIVSHWGLESTRGKSTTTTTLTFKRFLALFPQVASRIMLEKRDKLAAKLPGPDVTKFPAQSQNLPAPMLHSGFGGLIPKDGITSAYLELLQQAHQAFLVESGRVCWSREANKDFGQAFSEKYSYMRSAMLGPMPSDTRIKCLIAFGLDSVSSVQSMIDVVNRAYIERKVSTRLNIGDFPKRGDRVLIMNDEDKLNTLIAEAAQLVPEMKTNDSPAGPSTTPPTVEASGLDLL